MKPLTTNEAEILEFIKKIYKRHGAPPTYQQIQHQFDFKSIGSVQQYVGQLVEKGYLRVPMGSSQKRAMELVENDQVIELPLLGRVAAGKPIEAKLSHQKLEVPKSLLKRSGDHFALQVSGQSMIEDGILDGDFVVVRRQEQAENGQTVVALIDNEATIKTYYKKQNAIELHPANPEFNVIKVGAHQDFKIEGLLVSVIRKY